MQLVAKVVKIVVIERSAFKMRTIIKNVLLVLLVIVSIFCLAVFSEYLSYYAVKPSSETITLTNFLNSKVRVRDVRKFEIENKTNTVVIGIPGLLSFPSGPPVYIFDEQGVLVDWCYDSGDAPLFYKKWEHLLSAQPLGNIKRENEEM